MSNETQGNGDEYRDPAQGHDHSVTTERCHQFCPAWDRVQFAKSVEQTIHNLPTAKGSTKHE